MIDNSSIYNNSKIPCNFYYAKLIRVETEDTGFEFPKIRAQLQILPKQGVRKNTVLSAIIYPSNKARNHYMNFKRTFPIWNDRKNGPQIGQAGSIWVYDSEYDGISAIVARPVCKPSAMLKVTLVPIGNFLLILSLSWIFLLLYIKIFW